MRLIKKNRVSQHVRTLKDISLQTNIPDREIRYSNCSLKYRKFKAWVRNDNLHHDYALLILNLKAARDS